MNFKSFRIVHMETHWGLVTGFLRKNNSSTGRIHLVASYVLTATQKTIKQCLYSWVFLATKKNSKFQTADIVQTTLSDPYYGTLTLEINNSNHNRSQIKVPGYLEILKFSWFMDQNRNKKLQTSYKRSWKHIKTKRIG